MFSDRSDHSDHIEATFQRSLSLRPLRSLESGFHMIAMIAELFFLSDHSDRSDNMETGVNLSQQPSPLPPQLAATCTPYKHIERTPLSSDYS